MNELKRVQERQLEVLEFQFDDKFSLFEKRVSISERLDKIIKILENDLKNNRNSLLFCRIIVRWNGGNNSE